MNRKTPGYFFCDFFSSTGRKLAGVRWDLTWNSRSGTE